MRYAIIVSHLNLKIRDHRSAICISVVYACQKYPELVSGRFLQQFRYMNLWIKYFKDNESSSDVGWSSTQSSTNASPLHQGKKYRDIKLTNVHKTYCMSKVDIQGIQLFKVINLKQRSTQIEQIDFFYFHFGFYYFEELL